ncbi:unnamed protein product [Brachionus calyciflorus]|uniref:EF-hand domain-containing protein n=1 Tax=Brachionus calyciflorus TaxID=104777 RepID=A0A813YF57_9BILA|nr:unnamed protein product [Brachionus calyciflorus]
MGNKKAKEKIQELSEDEILHYCILTDFSKEIILHYYDGFLADCPSGKLSKKEFQKMYKQIFPHSKSIKFCLRIFEIFDRNKDNYLDFEEFLLAIKVTTSGDINDKLKVAFEIYDLKGDGKLDKKEMIKTLINIYEMAGEDNKSLKGQYQKFAEKKVDILFERFNLKKDNYLTLSEFTEGCLNDEYLKNLLNATFINNKLPNINKPKNFHEIQLQAIQNVLSM